ncbi:MAG: hypothetical protein CMJ90_13855 [Planctomycetes bacterium]|nr:hypothetical protein [Planctomycetota bacterium]
MSDSPRSDAEAVRLGVVSYLNAMPLVHALDDGCGVDLVGAPPSGIAAWLRSGRIDVGLVPVIELLRQPGLELVSDACVGAFGPVDSVLLLTRTPPDRVVTCALDPNSRTSQVLVQILLRDHYGACPRFEETDPETAWSRGTHDAVLVIGDQALRMARWLDGAHVIDLAAAWAEMTGLPFVFAAWAARAGVIQRCPNLGSLLEDARDRGLEAVDAIASDCAAWGDLSAEEARVYLTDRIRYRLAAPDRAGLARFLELARSFVVGSGSEEPCSTSG